MRMSAPTRYIVGFGLGALAMAAFFDASTLHGHYDIRYVGIRYVSKNELVFLLWYALWGGLAAIAFASAFSAGIASRLLQRLSRALARPREWVTFSALFVFAAALGFRYAVLLDEPI